VQRADNITAIRGEVGVHEPPCAQKNIVCASWKARERGDRTAFLVAFNFVRSSIRDAINDPATYVIEVHTLLLLMDLCTNFFVRNYFDL